MTTRYYSLPDLQSGYSLEDFDIVVGGTAYPLSSFGFYLLSHSETGVAPIQQRLDEYVLRTGARYDGYRVEERIVLLTGRFYGTSASYVDGEMARLARLIVGKQVLLRSNVSERQLTCRYVDGLTGNNAARNGQPAVLRFAAYNPWWEAFSSVTPVAIAVGETSITYNGTAYGLPVFVITSSVNGGELVSVECNTGGGIIEFSGLMLDIGDTLTIDLTDRAAPSITKNSTSVWGNVDIENSNLVRMRLLPGDNTITLNVVSGSVAGTVSWTEHYWGIDA